MTDKKYTFRFAVVMNFFGFVLLLALFYLVKLRIVNVAFIALEIIPIGVIIFSFRAAFVKSDIWKLTHSPNQSLDEREMQIIYEATKISYSVYAIAVLIIIYLFLLCGFGQIDAVIAISLLYMAHILPASIIAWNEKVENEH